MINIHVTYYMGDIEASHANFINVSSARVAAQILKVHLGVVLEIYGDLYNKISIVVRAAKLENKEN